MIKIITTEEIIAAHQNHGKIEIALKKPIKTKKDLSIIYTPGVAEICRMISKDKNKAYDYTIKGNSVAVISDGSAVLGLGNIGPEAAMPVMEGKAALFKQLAGIDAIPICLNTQDKDEIIMIVKNLAPTFGGINLEDISAPKCFEIEKELQDTGIPVMHDDQHGTAIVVLAALMNAAKVVWKNIPELKIVVNGAGAAGMAITKLLLCLDVDRKICSAAKEVIICDSKGIIHQGRNDLNIYKKEILKSTNPRNVSGGLAEAIKGADVFIGVSKGNVLTKKMVESMNENKIVFAMANPDPEIDPKIAKEITAVFGTGRSDYPNQINNSLAFPGVFRGALDSRAVKITNEMKIAAAKAIAKLVAEPTKDNILPSTLNPEVAGKVAEAVKKTAQGAR